MKLHSPISVNTYVSSCHVQSHIHKYRAIKLI